MSPPRSVGWNAIPARSRISPLASRFSSCPLRPMVITCGCSSSSRWSEMAPCLRSRTSSCCSSKARAYSIRLSCRTMHLRIDRESVDGVEGLADRFVERGMRVDRLHHHVHRSLGFHRGNRLGEQFERVRSDDVDAQDFPELLVGHDLDEAVMLAEDARAAVAHEREPADLNLAAGGARLRFGESHTADSGISVGSARDPCLVDRYRGLARHVGHGDHSFAGCDVRQLGSPRHHGADRIHHRFAGQLVRVDLDEPAIELYLGVLEPDVLRVWLAPDRDQQFLDLELFLLALLGCQRELDAFAGLLNVLSFRPGLDPDLLLPELSLEF